MNAADAADRARRRFDALWRQQAPVWRAGAIDGLAMRDGLCVPLDFCVTTIARVVDQALDDSALDRAVAALADVAPGQFIYPRDQRHITLVGCTPRLPEAGALVPRRLARMAEIVGGALAGLAPADFDLGGVGVQGAQVFVEVVPHDRRWQDLREGLIDALVAAGERPQIHADTAPIHLNVLRVTDAASGRLARLLDAIEDRRGASLGRFQVSRITLVETDFVVTPRLTRNVTEFGLSGK